MTQLKISSLAEQYNQQSIEIVERKGIGHPDTICDALAEQLSLSLCEYYMQKFGLILHHNVDKVLLRGGSSQPAFGGGQIQLPMEIYMAGRATCEFKGHHVPLEELVQSTCTNWLVNHLHAYSETHPVKIHNLIRPGSSELVELYLRQKQSGVALANDTSCGVGFAPLSVLEQVVLEVERHLNSASMKSECPEFGEDIKVMGVRVNHRLDLTVACAFVDRYVDDINDYQDKKALLCQHVERVVKTITDMPVSIAINSADDISTQSVYITVTGTSAECGDDGEVGRGNRVNGLISPYRPMNMEAAAGKNPVTHVGKLYNVIAQKIAMAIVEEIPGVNEAYCSLVSQIGSPIDQPKVVDLKVRLEGAVSVSQVEHEIQAIIQTSLASINQIRNEFLNQKIIVY